MLGGCVVLWSSQWSHITHQLLMADLQKIGSIVFALLLKSLRMKDLVGSCVEVSIGLLGPAVVDCGFTSDLYLWSQVLCIILVCYGGCLLLVYHVSEGRNNRSIVLLVFAIGFKNEVFTLKL